jgi:hypothetical protein
LKQTDRFINFPVPENEMAQQQKEASQNGEANERVGNGVHSATLHFNSEFVVPFRQGRALTTTQFDLMESEQSRDGLGLYR